MPVMPLFDEGVLDVLELEMANDGFDFFHMITPTCICDWSLVSERNVAGLGGQMSIAEVTDSGYRFRNWFWLLDAGTRPCVEPLASFKWFTSPLHKDVAFFLVLGDVEAAHFVLLG